MAKLYFRYGAMGSSKTANALMTKFNYEEKGCKTILLKPAIDTRDGTVIVKSRIGLFAEASTYSSDDNLAERPDLVNDNIDCIIVDEVQFSTRAHIEQLKKITEDYDIPVICYGLRTDFQTNMFEGSKRLFEIADSISEVKSICHCGKKAIVNGRIKNNKIIYSGEQIELGGSDEYVGLCYKCWKMGRATKDAKER